MGNQLDELYRYFGKLPYLYVCLYHVFVTTHKIWLIDWFLCSTMFLAFWFSVNFWVNRIERFLRVTCGRSGAIHFTTFDSGKEIIFSYTVSLYVSVLKMLLTDFDPSVGVLPIAAVYMSVCLSVPAHKTGREGRRDFKVGGVILPLHEELKIPLWAERSSVTVKWAV